MKTLRRAQIDSASRTAGATFKDAMAGAIHTTVGPLVCFPLTQVRRTVPGGVEKLRTLFKNNGFQTGRDNVIVIDIDVELEGGQSIYFQSLGVLVKNVGDRVQSQQTWYRIENEKNILLANMEPRYENASVWDSFQWPVTRLESKTELSNLRQFARSINARHHESV